MERVERRGYHIRVEEKPSSVPYADREEHVVYVPTVAQEYAIRKAYRVAGRNYAQALGTVPPISRAQIGQRNLLAELTQ